MQQRHRGGHMDPRTDSYWTALPIALRLSLALATVGDLTGAVAEKILGPMRQLYKNIDAEVAEFAADVSRLEKALGGRAAVMARHHARMNGRSEKVDQMAGFIAHGVNVSDELIGRRKPN